VGNVVHRQGPGNTAMTDLPMQEMFFRTISDFGTDIDQFIRGASQFLAQEVDVKVHDSIRNFLFTGIPGDDVAFDLIALNLQRGRDHALKSYNDIRRRIGLGQAKDFAEITSNVNVQNLLSTAYGGQVNRVEAWIGMMAEDHARGSSFGPTLRKLWEKQFTMFRDGDRFFYERNIFSSEIRDAIPRVQALTPARRRKSTPRGNTFRDLIIRNTHITDGELPKNIFFV